MYYVYQYKDPDSDIPFYVGYGKNNRYLFHLQEAKSNRTKVENGRKNKYIRELLSSGKSPIIEKIAEHLTEEEAQSLEKEMIKKYGRLDLDENGILLNIHPGGTGGWNFVHELGLDLSGENNGFYGKTHTPKNKKRMSDIKTGTTLSQKTRSKISKSHTGRTFSNEHRQHISKSLLGKSWEERGYSLETQERLKTLLKQRAENKKGKTFEQIYGDKAKDIKNKMSEKLIGRNGFNPWAGKSWDEAFGNEVANERRKNQSDKMKSYMETADALKKQSSERFSENNKKRQGKTIEEIFGVEKASLMRKKYKKRKPTKGNKGNRYKQHELTCPHCKKVGGASGMKRYHFDNCKNYR